MPEQNDWALEPLTYRWNSHTGHFDLYAANGDYIGNTAWESNAKRIIAAYNACAGVPTEMLEAMVKLKADEKVKAFELIERATQEMFEMMANFQPRFRVEKNALIIPDEQEAPDDSDTT